MGINFDYANEEAIDKIGVLTSHDTSLGEDSGWTRSVIQKIKNDILNSPQTKAASSSFDRGDYDSDELAAWDWYQDNVVDQDHWKQLVKDYNADVTNPDHVDPADYDPEHQYIPKDDGAIAPPETSTYSGSNNPNHELAVSTEALNFMAGQLDQIVGDGTGMLFDARNTLNAIAMKPGGFAKAEILRQKIDGVNATDAGLRGDSMGLMLAVHEALYAVKTGLRQMARDYDNAEDFNSMTADQLGESMGSAWGKIGNIGDYGQGSGSTAGGN
ncbi:hypothetical protein GCM10010435_42950 [Winogradskya consettensis]|uniref:Uncharacterized protein n=2 Tax=Winogradskya TaxID=3240235 RepID=A0A919SUN0_9ACTN|nr:MULTISPECIES: hypothetical protein [Actinoplanes]GIE19789.1 hypothetical protein Ahu01nite_028910 [Actinoplanes humidus]GIM77929.1 hypothetical protein Aco04nite_57820 [Actinoplanes consettensis]